MFGFSCCLFTRKVLQVHCITLLHTTAVFLCVGSFLITHIGYTNSIQEAIFLCTVFFTLHRILSIAI